MSDLFASATILGLAWFAAVNAAVSLAAAALSLAVTDAVVTDSRRSRRLLMLRLLPFLAAAGVSVALFIPAHLRLEPVDADERFGWTLLALAAAGVGLTVRAGVHTAGVALSSFRLSRALRRDGGRSGSYVISPMVRGIALIGVLRPRVVVGSAARRVLSSSELDVALEHERAHQASFDNFTRAIMRCVPDFFAFTPSARRLERLWNAQAECLADARAARGCRERAARLASALTKVARLQTLEPASAACSLFHQGALLELRVHRLVREQPDEIAAFRRRVPYLLSAVTFLVAAWMTDVPSRLHFLTEFLIARLP